MNDDHDLEGLIQSITRTFEIEILKQHTRIDVLEESTRRLEARVAQLEAALGIRAGTARSRELVASLQSLVAPQDVIGLHSESRDADGVVTRLYDLRDGRTGIEVIPPGESSSGLIRRAD